MTARPALVEQMKLTRFNPMGTKRFVRFRIGWSS